MEKVKFFGKGGLYEDMYLVLGLVGSGWVGFIWRVLDGVNVDGGSILFGIKIEKGKDVVYFDGNFEGV